jgi:anti-sigma-K factor RskA
MPVLPPALSYELWLIPAQGAPVSLGGFEVRADHTFQRRYARDARGFAAVAVTIERAPGDWPTPTLSDLTLEVKLAV